MNTNCWTKTIFNMEELGISIQNLKKTLAQAVDDFRVAAGARNVEIIMSSKDEKCKCDVTIRY